MRTISHAATSTTSPLAPFAFERRDLRPEDVAIEILYSGVCHSNLHQARNDWGWSSYPLVPGHEIGGRATAVGSAVTRYKEGDRVAVGCMVDSCLHCDQCDKDEEQLCRHGNTQTYNGRDRITGDPTFGGYSKHLVVRQEFVLPIPDAFDIAKAAPLLCAGITTWSPLKTWGVKAGTRVGVIGLGGLGHMAVKLAAGLGATLVIVGQLGPMNEMSTLPLLTGRRRVSGSPIGGIRETQEMLDLCAENNILPDVEMIRMDQINEAFERMERSDVRYRFVIDMASLDGPSA